MLRKYIIVINFLLVIFCFLLANKIYEVWSPKAKPSDSSQAAKQYKAIVPTLKTSVPQRNPRQSYQIIVDKDLFRPERTEWKPEIESEQGKAAAAPSPQLKVFGIVISGGFKHAWVEEEGKGGKLKRIGEGEMINGWKVNTIEFSSLSLINGKRVAQYNLIEPGKPKQRTVPKSLTTPVKPPAPQLPKPVPPQQLPPPQQRSNPLTQPQGPNPQ